MKSNFLDLYQNVVRTNQIAELVIITQHFPYSSKSLPFHSPWVSQCFCCKMSLNVARIHQLQSTRWCRKLELAHKTVFPSHERVGSGHETTIKRSSLRIELRLIPYKHLTSFLKTQVQILAVSQFLDDALTSSLATDIIPMRKSSRSM